MSLVTNPNSSYWCRGESSVLAPPHPCVENLGVAARQYIQYLEDTYARPLLPGTSPLIQE